MGTIWQIATGFWTQPLWIAGYVFGLWLLRRLVRRRLLDLRWVVWGASPLTVVPAIVGALLQRRPVLPEGSAACSPAALLPMIGVMHFWTLVPLLAPFFAQRWRLQVRAVHPTQGLLDAAGTWHAWEDIHSPKLVWVESALYSPPGRELALPLATGLMSLQDTQSQSGGADVDIAVAALERLGRLQPASLAAAATSRGDAKKTI